MFAYIALAALVAFLFGGFVRIKDENAINGYRNLYGDKTGIFMGIAGIAILLLIFVLI